MFLTSDVTGDRILPGDKGIYTLDSGSSYTAVVTRYGYVGQKKTFTAGEANKTVQIKLEKAPDSTLKDIELPTDWPLFRKNDENNGVVDVRTPITAEDTVLVWANKLGEGYTLEEIRARILRNIYKQPPFPELVHHLPQHYRVRGKPQKKVTGLRALYFRYCYELHIIVKRPASVKRVSFLLREDIAKLDRLDAETRFLGKHHIGTMEELTTHWEAALVEVEALTAQRQELRKELRRCSRQGDAIAADEVKQRISALSGRIRAARKEVVLCDGIAQRSGQVRENLGRLVKQREIERKEQLKNELFRRRGGASREDVAGNR